jgi:uncharacterized protein
LIRASRRSSAKSVTAMPEAGSRTAAIPFTDLKTALMSGTSIGGIVALAAAFEIPMKTVVEVFVEYGESIFPPRKKPTSVAGKVIDMVMHAFQPRYASAPLRDVITRLIPADATLADALHPVAIPAINLTEGKPQVFKTRHIAEWNRDWKLKVVDIALATSAAPTFFELAQIGDQLYADGGLFANAPDLIAIHEADHFLNVPHGAIRILSIGTTTEKYSISAKAGRNFGIFDWMSDERLFSVIISSQQQFAEQLVDHRLGDNYLRIDSEPSNQQIADLGLDVADKASCQTLMGLAYKRTTDILGTDLVPFLKHQPQLKISLGT